MAQKRPSPPAEANGIFAKRQKQNDPDMDSLRLKSRQTYLEKRTTEQLVLFRQRVRDEQEELRNADGQLDEDEKADFERNRIALEEIDARLAIDDHFDGYMIPDALQDKKASLNQRIVDRDQYGREKYTTEHEEWEAEQTKRSKAQARVLTDRLDESDFEFVFDPEQEIKYFAKRTLAGEMTAEQRALAAKIDAAEDAVSEIDKTRKSLPVYTYRQEFLDAVAAYPVLVVVGETGSGKTTQLPQYLMEEGYIKKGRIGITQPRRVAAMSVAARVADERGARLGREVGYSIRFEPRYEEDTACLYMTDGMLVREMLADPSLEKYSCIVIDEAHERSLSTEILLSTLKDLSRARGDDFKLIISSATINAQMFQEYFDNAPVLNIPGRKYPVDLHFTPSPESNYLSAAVTSCFQIALSQPPGDILVFLTGQEEIEAAEQSITETCRKLGRAAQEMIVCPIYASLPTDLQAKIFETTPPKARKIILATNIAETSITLPNVKYVIDSGFVKENVYNPRTGMESLVVTPCSRASANQRAGRAGRVGPGKCFYLFTEYAYWNELQASPTPEIQRSNLTSVILLLKSLGIHDLMNFDWMEAPATDAIIRSLEELYSLGAMNDRSELTKLGRQMAEFPLNPMLAKAILSANILGCVDEVLTIIAMLGEASALFYRPKDKRMMADAARKRFSAGKEGGDHFALLRIYNEWADAEYSLVWSRENFLQQRSLSRARDVREQLVKLCERVDVVVSSVSDDGAGKHNTAAADGNMQTISKALTAGFFGNAARLQKDGESYRTAHGGHTVYLHPSSVLFEGRPKWIIYSQLVETAREYARECLPIQPEWLTEVAPHVHKAEELEKMGDGRKMPKGVGKAAML